MDFIRLASRKMVKVRCGGPRGIASEQRTESYASRLRRVCPLQQIRVDAVNLRQFGWYRERLRPMDEGELFFGGIEHD